ncbi:MAG: hypothetical protein R3F65_14800 [bacterium]
MLANYYALHNAPGQIGTPAGRWLAERFLATYEARCPDPAALRRALPLPLARGALIMATTDFFPDRPLDERDQLIQLAGILSARSSTRPLPAQSHGRRLRILELCVIAGVQIGYHYYRKRRARAGAPVAPAGRAAADRAPGDCRSTRARRAGRARLARRVGADRRPRPRSPPRGRDQRHVLANSRW